MPWLHMACLRAVRFACSLWMSQAKHPPHPPLSCMFLAHHDEGQVSPAERDGASRAFRGGGRAAGWAGWAAGWVASSSGRSNTSSSSDEAVVYEHCVRRASDACRLTLLSLSPVPPAVVPSVTPHKVLYAELRSAGTARRPCDVSSFLNARLVSFHAACGPSCGRVTLRHLVRVMRAHGCFSALPAADDPGLRLVLVHHDLGESAFGPDDVLAW